MTEPSTNTDPLERPDAHLDPDVADTYDVADGADLDPTMVDVLVDFASDGPAVEFAIGTGRVALALSARGVAVSGMDISEPMLAQMRTKPGADDVRAVVGDMTTTVLGSDFSVAYLVFNTIMNLRTQEAQVECFRNAARHLRRGGRFVVETMVPQLRGLGMHETVRPFDVSAEHLGFDEYIDLPEQILVSHHYRFRDGRASVSSNAFRYVWPSELDLMAKLAGMELEHRWANWSREPFTGDSHSHVSVWRLSGD